MVKNVKLHKSTMGRFQTIYTARFHLHPNHLPDAPLGLSLQHLHQLPLLLLNPNHLHNGHKKLELDIHVFFFVIFFFLRGKYWSLWEFLNKNKTFFLSHIFRLKTFTHKTETSVSSQSVGWVEWKLFNQVKIIIFLSKIPYFCHLLCQQLFIIINPTCSPIRLMWCYDALLTSLMDRSPLYFTLLERSTSRFLFHLQN